jgi:hypothetical protein
MEMSVKWFLFETKAGLWLLALLERKARLAVVNADWLGKQPSGWPVAAAEEQ